VVMIRSELLELWTEKERQVGRRLTIEEVSLATGLDRKTISGLLKGETSQFNGLVLAKVCEYFGVKDGQPVPFLKVRYPEAV